MFQTALLVAAAVSLVVAQRPTNVSICDYYTTAILKTNDAANQKTLMTMIINTAAAGNYTQPNVGLTVSGFLASGMFNGTAVNLLPYFNGGFASTNIGGSSGVALDFLDDGGIATLKLNKAADTSTSNQYSLLTHLYEYFGALLGCSQLAYTGQASQYEIHKFMVLSYAEFRYFIIQVASSAASFGFDVADVTTIGNTLSSLFGYKCSPFTAIIPVQGSQLPSICTGDGCPSDPYASCGPYTSLSRPTSGQLAKTATSSTPQSSTSSGTSSNTPTIQAGLSTSISSSTSSNPSQPAAQSGQSGQSSLSSGAAAGIGVGATLGLVTIIILAFFIFRSQHRRRTARASPAELGAGLSLTAEEEAERQNRRRAAELGGRESVLPEMNARAELEALRKEDGVVHEMAAK